MIDELKAGRDTDALVAEKVMGYRWLRWYELAYESPDGLRRTLTNVEGWLTPPDYVECDLTKPEEMALPAEGPIMEGPYGRGLVDFCPSTDIAAAWMVVDKIHDMQPKFRLEAQPFVRPRVWWCELYGTGVVEASTAELAICIAALKYVEEKSQ